MEFFSIHISLTPVWLFFILQYFFRRVFMTVSILVDKMDNCFVSTFTGTSNEAMFHWRLYGWSFVAKFIYLYSYSSIYIHIHLFIFIFIFMLFYIHIHLFIFIFMLFYIHIHLFIFIFMLFYIHIHLFIFIFMLFYIHIHVILIHIHGIFFIFIYLYSHSCYIFIFRCSGSSKKIIHDKMSRIFNKNHSWIWISDFCYKWST